MGNRRLRIRPHVQRNPFSNVFSVPDTRRKQQVYAKNISDSDSDSVFIDAYTFEELQSHDFIARLECVKVIKEILDEKWPNTLQSAVWSFMLGTNSTKSCVIQGKPWSGMTLCSVMSTLAICGYEYDSVDWVMKYCAIYVVPSNAALGQVSDLFRMMDPDIKIQSCSEDTNDPRVIIGTPQFISKWVLANEEYLQRIKFVVFMESDKISRMENAIETSISFMRSLKTSFRVMLLSATMNASIRSFAQSIFYEDIIIRDMGWIFVDKKQWSMFEACLSYQRVVNSDKVQRAMLAIESLIHENQIIIVVNLTRMQQMVESVRGINGTICAPDIDFQDPVKSHSIQEFKTRKARFLITSNPLKLDWRFDNSNVKHVIFLDLPPRDPASADLYKLYSDWIGLATAKESEVLFLVSSEIEKAAVESIEGTIGYDFTEYFHTSLSSP